MSVEGIATKKQWCEDYFTFHPDSRTVTVVGSGETFPALFDYAYMSNNRDGGRVEQQKRAPHLTFFSEHRSLLTPRESRVLVNGKSFLVYIVKADLTEETFQAEAWLQ